MSYRMLLIQTHSISASSSEPGQHIKALAPVGLVALVDAFLLVASGLAREPAGDEDDAKADSENGKNQTNDAKDAELICWWRESGG